MENKNIIKPEEVIRISWEKIQLEMKNKFGKDIGDFKEFNESDFDFFVYRAHVLSSKDNAEKLKEKIVNNGFPAFVESFGDKGNLHAIYVGPFLSENDIVTNMDLIKSISESNNGEVSRWKL